MASPMLVIEYVLDIMDSMTRVTMQDTMAADPARAAVAAGRPSAARWPDGTSTSAPPRTGAPSGHAR